MDPHKNCEDLRFWDTRIVAELQRQVQLSMGNQNIMAQLQSQTQLSMENENENIPQGSMPLYTLSPRHLPIESPCDSLVSGKSPLLGESRVGASSFKNPSLHSLDSRHLANSSRNLFPDASHRAVYVKHLADIGDGSPSSMTNSALLTVDGIQINPGFHPRVKMEQVPYKDTYQDAIAAEICAGSEMMALNAALDVGTISSDRLSHRYGEQSAAFKVGRRGQKNLDTLLRNEEGNEPGSHLDRRTVPQLFANSLQGNAQHPEDRLRMYETEPQQFGNLLRANAQHPGGRLRLYQPEPLSTGRAMEEAMGRGLNTASLLRRSGDFTQSRHNTLLAAACSREGNNSQSVHYGQDRVRRLNTPRKRVSPFLASSTKPFDEPQQSYSRAFPGGDLHKTTGFSTLQEAESLNASRYGGWLPKLEEDWQDPVFYGQDVLAPQSQGAWLGAAGSHEGGLVGPDLYEEDSPGPGDLLEQGRLHHYLGCNSENIFRGGLSFQHPPRQLLNSETNSRSRTRGPENGIRGLRGGDGGYLEEAFGPGPGLDATLQLPAPPVAGSLVGLPMRFLHQKPNHAEKMEFLDESDHQVAKQLLRTILASAMKHQEEGKGVSGRILVMEDVDISSELKLLQWQVLPTRVFHEDVTASGRASPFTGNPPLSLVQALQIKLQHVKNAYEATKVTAGGIFNSAKELALHVSMVNDEALNDLGSVSSAYMERFCSLETLACNALLCFLKRDCTALLAHTNLHPQVGASRRRSNLPKNAIGLMRLLLFRKFLSPYPTEREKVEMAWITGLSISQVNNWFINARVRTWRPIVDRIIPEGDVAAESPSESEEEPLLVQRQTTNKKRKISSGPQGMTLLVEEDFMPFEWNAMSLPPVLVPDFSTPFLPAASEREDRKQKSDDMMGVPHTALQVAQSPGNTDYDKSNWGQLGSYCGPAL